MKAVLRFLIRLAGLTMQMYWQIRRPLSLGVMAIIPDEQSRVLLVRHSYRNGWHLPGGTMERGETNAQTMKRELAEELHLQCEFSDLDFQGLFYQRFFGKHDHYSLFIVKRWHIPEGLTPCWEIEEYAFFSAATLPPDVGQETARRLKDFWHGSSPKPVGNSL